jgi:cytochrome c biogenesis protein CcdA
MLKAAGSFTAKFAIIFGVLYLVYLLAVSAFPDLRDEILDSLVSQAVIVILTVATLCYAWARNAIRKQL